MGKRMRFQCFKKSKIENSPKIAKRTHPKIRNQIPGNYHHHHHHAPSNDESAVRLTKFQETFLSFAKAVKWTYLANFLREHLELCCCSAALFLAVATCSYLIPKPAVKPLQQAFTLIVFLLVGVPTSFDVVMDITGGKINIHVLMALAAFASAFMGNALEGGLLLAMFNLAHIAEEYFTGQCRIDVKELKDNHLESTLVLDVKNEKLPSFSVGRE